ncbi:MAG: hypothetical protein WEF86_03490 [Gemmatimonadota bacterium]
MNSKNSLMAGALLLLSATPLTAQSLFSTRGLGVPMPAVDARAAALGGIGVGLIGFHTSLTNPAELAGVTRRGVTAALQPVTTSFDVAGAEDGTAGTRFPLIGVVYPASDRIVASLGFGSFLEQSWGILTQSSQVIGDRTYEVSDLQSSRGGIAQARVSAVYSFSPTFAVGAAAGLLTGNVTRTVVRSFVDSTGILLRPFEQDLSWRYSAPIASVGMRLDVAGRVRLGASALVGGKLKAHGTSDDADDRVYGAPLELSAGASARLTSLVLGTIGAVWSRMPETEGAALTQETLRVGGGIEYQGLRFGERTFPLRLGGHWSELPYHAAGEEAPAEWGLGGGFGFRLGDPMDPAAVADVAIERGGRSGLGSADLEGGLEESLWRFTLSLSLFAR